MVAEMVKEVCVCACERNYLCALRLKIVQVKSYIFEGGQWETRKLHKYWAWARVLCCASKEPEPLRPYNYLIYILTLRMLQ